MEVKDNRGKMRNNLKPGDVICFYNEGNGKYYGLIAKDTDGNFGLIDPVSGDAFLDDQNVAFKDFCDTNAHFLIDELHKDWDHVEKINAQLVIEDK